MDRSEQNLTTVPAGREPWTKLLLLVLAVSAALRVWLVVRGGQFFWADESRYYAASESLDRLAAGDVAGFLHRLLGGADHLFFKVLALVPAGIMRAAGDHPFIPGLFCAAFSVANIYLVGRIARAAGAGGREAFSAALLAACANTGFYYARHLLPYDAAMTFCLLSLLVGWSGDGWRRSLACGVLAGFAFLTYNGYWLFGGTVLIGHVLQAWREPKRARIRAAVAGLGLMLPIVLLIGLARWLAGVDLVASFLSFSKNIDQGDFGRGWRLMLDYFWSAEKLNMILGLAGLLLVACGAATCRRWTSGMRWLAGALCLVAGLLFCSDVLHKFVVYGRTARQLVPLVCLASAFALERLWRMGNGARRAATTVIILVVAQAIVNFSRPLQQLFPPEFTRLANQKIHELQKKGEERQLVILYADHILGKHSFFEALPDHDVIMAADNPTLFPPYLFEGFPEDLRTWMEKNDLKMQLIAINEARFNHPTDLRLPYPGVVQLTLRLPKDKPGTHEPLLVTGKTGAGDLIYIIYDLPSGIRLGYDHWGVGGAISDPVQVDYDKPVTVILSVGALHEDRKGPQEEGATMSAPDLRHWLYVEVNGRVIWSHPADFHPATPAAIFFGKNYIGGSTCDTTFTGTLVKVESLLAPPAFKPQAVVH